MSAIGTGIALILLTSCMFAGSDSTIKYLGPTIPILVLLWTRYMFQTSVMAVWLWSRGGLRKFRSNAPGLQAIRGLLLLLNSTSSFYGLQHLPLAEYTALALLAPVATTVLAALILKERVSTSRWAMVVLGVIGMLCVIRPGAEGALGWGAVLPIAGALCYAGFQLVTRRIASRDDLVLTNLLSAVIVVSAIACMLAVSPIDIAPSLRAATPGQWALLLLLGVCATGGHVCMSAAVRVAPLSVLMPFAYAQIGFAAAIGWLVFGHAPDGWAVVGIFFIALGGAGTVWLNGRGTR